MTQRFPPLAPQEPCSALVRRITRGLPEISLPWLEIGLALALFVLLRLS